VSRTVRWNEEWKTLSTVKLTKYAKNWPKMHVFKKELDRKTEFVYFRDTSVVPSCKVGQVLTEREEQI
jgi:hypothetical protein